jgi:hypothetical protein
MNELKTQGGSDELRALNTTEIDAVSGAKGKLIQMGMFGDLFFDDNGCVVWTMTNYDGNGGWTSTQVGQCPK